MPSTDPVSSITDCYRLIVSYTDPVHSFIISSFHNAMNSYWNQTSELPKMGLTPVGGGVLGAAAISVFILNHYSLRSPTFMLKLKFGVQCDIFSCLPVQLYLGEIVWSCAAQINGRRSNKQVDFKFPLETRE